MLESNIKLMKSKNLNLLLKQQIIQQIEEVEEVEETSQIDQTIKSTNNDDQKKITYQSQLNVKETIQFYKNQEISTKYEDMKVELANIQVEESTAAIQDQILTETFDLLENLLDHILQYIDCMVLEIKSSFRLTEILNSYILHQNKMNNQVSETLKKLHNYPEVVPLEDIKSKIFVVLNQYDHVKQLKQEHDQRKYDYKLALKNFKIILEVMDINERSLEKLRKQFTEVLLNYQHARVMINQELPFIIQERMKILVECLKMLGMELDVWGENRGDVACLVKELANICLT